MSSYHFRVRAGNNSGLTLGADRDFTTLPAANQPPTTPTSPNPSNGATGISISPSLSWSCYDPEGGTVRYNVYYGTTSSNMTNYVGGVGTSTILYGLNGNQTYYWKVVAYDEQNNSTQGPIWHFTTQSANQPPTTPTSPNPSNGATGVPTSPSLSWSCYDPEGGTVGYDVYYGTSTSTMSNHVSGSGTSTSLSGLSSGQTYYWRVIAYDPQNNSTTGPIWHFTTQAANQPPTTPSNPNPSDGATGVSLSPTLSWTCTDPNGDAVGYDLYFGTSSLSMNLLHSGNGTSITLNGLSNNQNYYWKVIAYDSHNASSEGPVWHFNTSGGQCFSDCESNDCGDYGGQMFEAAQYLCELGIVEGINGALEPDISITRGMLAKVALYSLYNGPSHVPSPLVSDYFPSIYPDLQDNTTYYYRAAKALLYLEYGDGISPFDRDRGCFYPEDYIQRCFVLKVLMETFNIAPLSSGTNVFDDFGPSGYANSGFWGYAQKAYNLDIVQTTHFRPDDYCTRGEAFLYLYRILTGIANNTIPAPNPVNTESPATSSFFIPANLSPEVVNAMRGVEYGNFNYYNKDFFDIPGYMDLSFGVAYNSYLTEMPDDFYPVKPLGKAWTHTYDMYMNIVADTYNNRSIYVFHIMNGALLMYKDNNGTLTTLTEGNYYELSQSGSNKYILKSTDQISYTFERQSTSDGIYYLTQIKDRNNNAIDIAYSYGTDHYRITSVSTLGRSLNFYYTSGTDLVSHVTDPINRTVYFYYSNDTNKELTSLKDAKNQTTSFSYGTMDFEKGLLKEITLPKGNHVYNNYQQRKLVSMSRTSPTGNTYTDITISPNYQNGSSTSTVTENLTGSQSVTTTYTMNSQCRITNVNDNCNTDVSYEYNISDKPDLVSKATDNKANIQTTYDYNSKGLPTTVTISAGGEALTTMITYTSLNDVHEYTDARGNTTTYHYTNGNLTSIVDALGHTTSISSNSYGKPTQVTDAMGVSTNYGYNSYGNKTSISIPSLSLSSSVSYDNVSRVTSVTDFANRTTSYTYDNNDNVLTITDPMNNTTTYTFDANDNVTQITDAKSNSTNMVYDDNDFMTSLSFQGATRSYTYNRDGTVATFTDPNGHTFNYTYNSSGELTSDGYAALSYNNKGQISSVTKDGKAITYSYDAFGRTTSIAYDGKTVSYTYDNNGNVLTITYPGSKTVTYTYDALNRITSVKDWNNATTTYTYRSDGQLNYYQYPNNVRATYSYDGSGRCNGFSTKRNSGSGSVIAEYNFTLDDLGNHTQETFSEPYTDYPFIPTSTTNCSYNNANRLLTAGSLSFGYDSNGNTTSCTGRDYSYDEADHLTSVSGDYTASFTYDGLGNRRTAIRNGTITKYVLNLLAGNPTVLMETDDSGNVQNYYIYGAYGLVSRIDASNNTCYYVYDYRGSTVAMIDATTSANVTHKYQYDDFGKLLQSEEADANPFRYVGKYGLMYEAEDLYFVRARYYDPTIGRFLSEDPIWGTNLYPYADNNPITGIDPSGKTLEIPGTTFETSIELVRLAKLITSSESFGPSVSQVIAKTRSALNGLAESISADAKLASRLGSTASPGAPLVPKTTPISSVGGGSMSLGAKLGAAGCLVGIAAGVVILVQDGYKAYKNAKQSKNFADFIDRQDKNGGWLYKGSQKIGNFYDRFLDKTLGKVFK